MPLPIQRESFFPMVKAIEALLAIIALSDGDLDRLARFCDRGTVDFRNTLYSAETPTWGNESTSREELQRRLSLPPEARP